MRYHHPYHHHLMVFSALSCILPSLLRAAPFSLPDLSLSLTQLPLQGGSSSSSSSSLQPQFFISTEDAHDFPEVEVTLCVTSTIKDSLAEPQRYHMTVRAGEMVKPGETGMVNPKERKEKLKVVADRQA